MVSKEVVLNEAVPFTLELIGGETSSPDINAENFSPSDCVVNIVGPEIIIRLMIASTSLVHVILFKIISLLNCNYSFDLKALCSMILLNLLEYWRYSNNQANLAFPVTLLKLLCQEN